LIHGYSLMNTQHLLRSALAALAMVTVGLTATISPASAYTPPIRGGVEIGGDDFSIRIFGSGGYANTTEMCVTSTPRRSGLVPVKSAPYPRATDLYRLWLGDSVRVVGLYGSYFIVESQYSGQRYGYVHKQYVGICENSPWWEDDNGGYRPWEGRPGEFRPWEDRPWNQQPGPIIIPF
jgi:hypothetical protein